MSSINKNVCTCIGPKRLYVEPARNCLAQRRARAPSASSNPDGNRGDLVLLDPLGASPRVPLSRLPANKSRLLAVISLFLELNGLEFAELSEFFDSTIGPCDVHNSVPTYLALSLLLDYYSYGDPHYRDRPIRVIFADHVSEVSGLWLDSVGEFSCTDYFASAVAYCSSAHAGKPSNYPASVSGIVTRVLQLLYEADSLVVPPVEASYQIMSPFEGVRFERLLTHFMGCFRCSLLRGVRITVDGDDCFVYHLGLVARWRAHRCICECVARE